MRFCLMIEGQEGVTWEQWLSLALACEEHGFEALFTSDHYYSVMGARDRGSSDAWAVLAALAARTERVRLGTLVSPVTFRHPTVLAKAATTVDHVSRGRAEVGLGAGWWTEEHETHGFPFPPVGERIEMLAEQLEIVHGLFKEPVFTFQGSHYTLRECPFAPKPVQHPHLPVIVGGKGGPRIARLAARWADEYNTYFVGSDEARERFARVREAVEAEGRDQSAFTTSLMIGVVVGADRGELLHRVQRLAEIDGADASPEAHLADLQAQGWVAGTPEQALERLHAFEEAGVQRIMLQDLLVEDLEMLALLGSEVFPQAG
ncbi:MAG: TIGR03560 family F420-dependent LLM class oxidoreductase [Actinomycetota bacterium]